jgi:hypothetical protein
MAGAADVVAGVADGGEPSDGVDSVVEDPEAVTGMALVDGVVALDGLVVGVASAAVLFVDGSAGTPLVDAAVPVPEGLVFDADDPDPSGALAVPAESDAGLVGSASATPGLLAMAKPSPSATANALTRPTRLVRPIVAPRWRGTCGANGHYADGGHLMSNRANGSGPLTEERPMAWSAGRCTASRPR